jgi:hypothetical protein
MIILAQQVKTSGQHDNTGIILSTSTPGCPLTIAGMTEKGGF